MVTFEIAEMSGLKYCNYCEKVYGIDETWCPECMAMLRELEEEEMREVVRQREASLPSGGGDDPPSNVEEEFASMGIVPEGIDVVGEKKKGGRPKGSKNREKKKRACRKTRK